VEPDLFQRFARLAHDRAGIALGSGKEALVHARVAKRVRALQLPDEAAYLELLETRDDGDELLRFLDVISTHFTGFFREKDHFDDLEQALAAWAAAGQRRFRLWSCAASTGEEPWSMAMTVRAMPAASRLDVRILATDIAAPTLAQAQAGHYPGDQVAPVPRALASRFLGRLPDPSGEGVDLWAVAQELRGMVVFRRLNLARPPFPMKGPLDVVFCRNVVMYFDHPTRQRLFSAIEGLLRPGGLLCIGHTETLNGVRTGLRMVRPSVFRKPSAEAGR
jgi:chemotaxis protein methyltransferase CheR